MTTNYHNEYLKYVSSSIDALMELLTLFQLEENVSEDKKLSTFCKPSRYRYNYTKTIHPQDELIVK